MDKHFIDLCEQHELTTISAMFGKGHPVTVFLHWDDEYRNSHCVSGYGSTFERAFAQALSQITSIKAAA